MTRVATSWLVYRLTKSAFLLGFTSFAGQLPIFFLSPFAGVLVDRWNRHSTLLITQILAMLQSLALAGLALSGHITVRDVILLMLFQGLINTVDMPARQAFLVQMIERPEDLANAIALNSSMVNGARLAGPAVAGLIIGAVGEGYCFLIDGISYIAVIASLLAMRIGPSTHRVEGTRLRTELADGWRYVKESLPIRSALLLLALVSLVGMPYTVLMPMFAGPILHGGPNALGFLMSAAGVGALIGALTLAMRPSVLGLGRVIIWSGGIFGAALITFALSRHLWLSLIFVAIAGYGMMRHMAAINTILQTIVAPDKRGRVMSYYSLAIQGVTPFGSLGAGAMAARVGAPWTIVVGGALCVAGSAIFAWNLPKIHLAVRPIYAELGILPPIPPQADAGD
jgi:MFS family permease